MYEAIRDIKMTLDGDIAIENGDIAITSGEDWYLREANKRLRSGRDWKHHPSLGADLSRFTGEPNSRDTGRRIREAVAHSLGQDAIHLPATLDIKVIPTSKETINIVVAIDGVGQRTVVSHLSVNIESGTFVPVQEPDTTEPIYDGDYVAPTEITNKFQKRFRRE
jgi:hypothetical protein